MGLGQIFIGKIGIEKEALRLKNPVAFLPALFN